MTNQRHLTTKEAVAAVAVVTAIGFGFAYAGSSDKQPTPADVARDGTQNARDMWASFDRDSPKHQTTESLVVHLNLANGDNPSLPLRAYNMRQMRIRFAKLLGGTTDGPDADVLIPRQQVGECLAWAAVGLDEQAKDGLLSAQFVAVRCYERNTDGTKKTAREWPIP